MIWKKRIPGYVVTVLFAVVGLVCTGMHFYAAFAGFPGALRVILSCVVTLVAAGLTVLLAFLLRMLSKSIKKSLAEELTDRVKWQNILWIAGAAIAVCGLIFRIILALTATDVSENALFHAALTGEYTDDSTGGVRVRLYIAILGTLLKLAGGSVKGALVMQALLYVIAAVLVFCGVMLLGGRGGALLGEAVMLFLPLFPSARTVQDDVIFWLMLGAGFFVGALYVRYATDTDPEETFLMKILISIFTGLLVGIIFGWDAGLMILYIIAACAFFAEGVKPLGILPLFATFLVSSVGGFFVSVASPSAWTKYYFSDVKTILPLARDQHVVWIALIAALSLTAVSAFFVRKKRENVTVWMVIALFAILFAGQMPLSGVFAPAFLFLILAVLFGSSVSSLLVRAAMDVPEGKAAEAKGKARDTRHHARREEKPAPLPRMKETGDAAGDDADVDKMLEHVWVEQIVAEAMGEDTSEEKAAIKAALREAEEAEELPGTDAEIPAVPSGMVLPHGDGAVDADTKPRMPGILPGTPTGAPIALQREPEQPAAPAAPALSAEAVGLGSVADLARRMEEDRRRAEAEAEKLALAQAAEAEAEKPAPALSAEAVGLGGVADLARRMEEDRKRAEAEAEKLAQRLSAEQGGMSLEDEIRRREMEETARREQAMQRKAESGVTAEEEAARRRAEEEEAARRRAEEEAARRRAEEEEAARRRAEEEEAARRRAEEEEAARRREEDERRQREEDERRRAEEEEAARLADEAERRRREDEEIAERRRREDEEIAARRREEDERRQREEDERRQREEDERRQREEDERRQREEDERRRREAERTTRTREERSPAARSVGRKPASEGFDFDISDGDDFDL
ncbi:MAG: hypothetical protein IJQ21_08430 [Lachnospiraceae bacterium]|nr:hypothetical protein [Lachnospiraceae bacterium]